MTSVSVFPVIRQARFQPKRTAMKYVYHACVAQDAERAAELLADAEAAIDVTLRDEGVPGADRRAALADYRRDLAAMIRANGGDLPDRAAR